MNNKTIKPIYGNENTKGKETPETELNKLIDWYEHIKNTKTGYHEWWGHVKGYGTAILLFGANRNPNRTYKETADYCAYTYIDELADIIDEDVTKYMGGHNDIRFHNELVRLNKSYNQAINKLKE